MDIHAPNGTGPGHGGTRRARLEAVLAAHFAPLRLEVVDDSASHAGHAGVGSGARETHYSVLLEAEAFVGRSRVDRSRMVHAVLQPEFAGGLHALSLTLRTPAEADPDGGRRVAPTPSIK